MKLTNRGIMKLKSWVNKIVDSEWFCRIGAPLRTVTEGVLITGGATLVVYGLMHIPVSSSPPPRWLINLIGYVLLGTMSLIGIAVITLVVGLRTSANYDSCKAYWGKDK